jgi:hypothetical protein
MLDHLCESRAMTRLFHVADRDGSHPRDLTLGEYVSATEHGERLQLGTLSTERQAHHHCRWSDAAPEQLAAMGKALKAMPSAPRLWPRCRTTCANCLMRSTARRLRRCKPQTLIQNTLTSHRSVNIPPASSPIAQRSLGSR